jgi:predicted metalloprotease with PDZ domain
MAEGTVLSDEYLNDKDLSILIDKLIELGAIEIRGYDSITGQFTYNITPKCRELVPELFEEHFKFINEIAFKLWQKDHIDITFDIDGTPMVMLKGVEYTRSIMNTLPDDERFFLENLIDKVEKDLKE